MGRGSGATDRSVVGTTFFGAGLGVFGVLREFSLLQLMRRVFGGYVVWRDGLEWWPVDRRVSGADVGAGGVHYRTQ